jgi:hypothetical protein
MSRTPVRLLVLALTSAVAAAVLPATAQAAPHCGTTWGSLAKAHSASDTETVDGIRAGRHTCFDRLVVDLGGQDARFSSYDVRYVPQVYSEGRGAPVPVRGAADLRIVLKAPAHDRNGHVTFRPTHPREVVDVAGYSAFRQVAWGGSFEGSTTLALGVRARLPFRVLTLAATAGEGPRLVVDVAKSW